MKRSLRQTGVLKRLLFLRHRAWELVIEGSRLASFRELFAQPLGLFFCGMDFPLIYLNNINPSFCHCKKFLSDRIIFVNLPFSLPKGQRFSYFLFHFFTVFQCLCFLHKVDRFVRTLTFGTKQRK